MNFKNRDILEYKKNIVRNDNKGNFIFLFKNLPSKLSDDDTIRIYNCLRLGHSAKVIKINKIESKVDLYGKYLRVFIQNYHSLLYFTDEIKAINYIDTNKFEVYKNKDLDSIFLLDKMNFSVYHFFDGVLKKNENEKNFFLKNDEILKMEKEKS